MLPLDSSLSYRLIGSISIVEMRNVPVCGVSTDCEVDPVRM